MEIKQGDRCSSNLRGDEIKRGSLYSCSPRRYSSLPFTLARMAFLLINTYHNFII